MLVGLVLVQVDLQLLGWCVDVNCDGVVSCEQYFVVCVMQFDCFDCNYDGYFDSVDVDVFFELVGCLFQVMECLVDVDGDGCVSCVEFNGMLMCGFDCMDVNQDDVFELDEMQCVMQNMQWFGCVSY